MPKTIYIQNTDLTRDKRFSYLTEDVVNTGSTIRVQSILGFESLTTSSGQIICIGEIGNERSEILRTSNSTAPSQSYKEITLRDSMNFDHPQDSKVYIVDWNRINLQWSATATGTKSTLSAYPYQILADQKESQIIDTSQTSGYYFVRFNESIGDTNSDWSDPVPFGGYDDNTVFAIKKRAIDELGETIDGSIITHEFLNQCLWEARREYHQSPGKRPFRRKYNFILGSALTGSFRIELPTDLEKPSSAENVYGIRLGTNANMHYYDKKEFDFDYRNVGHSTLTSAYTVGARDIYVANARDFTDSGVISIEGANVTYAGRSIAGGTLRITAQGSWNASAGSDVWQNAVYGLPFKFTVFADPAGSSYVYFNNIISTTYTGLNIYADYYRTLLGFDSDADILDEPQYDMYADYLKAKIKARKAKGYTNIAEDSDYRLWQIKLNNALATEYLSNPIKLQPDIGYLDIPI